MNVNNNLQIILASKSPRRKEILTNLGYDFTIMSADADESVDESIPVCEQVKILAKRKAEAVLPLASDECVIIGSDTLLEFEGKPLGKPKDEQDAKRMLASLSGKPHKVHTAVALIYRGKSLVDSDATTVIMRPYTKEEIDYYVGTGDPMDKAGSYGIQSKGGFLVEGIEGEMDTVIGFPSKLFLSMMEKLTKKREKKSDKLLKIAKMLEELYPDAACSLEFEGDAWKLLVMGRLSAQCTDERVNIVCRDLFCELPTAADMAYAPIEKIEELIKPCGLYRTKAESIKNASRMLVEEYDGVLPDTMEELLRFPGVGRKIANLLLGDIFHCGGVVTDTHCIRICGRFGMYPEKEKNPYKIEKILTPLLPPEMASDFCHRIVYFGREICTARSPKCAECPIGKAGLCKSWERKQKSGK